MGKLVSQQSYPYCPLCVNYPAVKFNPTVKERKITSSVELPSPLRLHTIVLGFAPFTHALVPDSCFWGSINTFTRYTEQTTVNNSI